MTTFLQTDSRYQFPYRGSEIEGGIRPETPVRSSLISSSDPSTQSAGARNYYKRYYNSENLDTVSWTTWTGVPAQVTGSP